MSRKKGLGSSEVACVTGENPFKSAYKLWLEKTGIEEPEDLSNSFLVNRGTHLEPIARSKAIKALGVNFEPLYFIDKEKSYFRYSSDGYAKDTNELIEIKCTSDKNHNQAKLGEVPPYYKAQLQWGLSISKANKIYYVSYNPGDIDGDDLVIIDVLPDQEYIDMLRKKCDEFWQLVESKTPPELSDSDYELIESKEFELAALALKQAKEELKLAEDRKDYLEKELLKIIGNKKRVKGYGCKIATIQRKGSVDYKSIPELIGVNLEKYRKSLSEYVKISFE
jgi:putative phage-type endonuclease